MQTLAGTPGRVKALRDIWASSAVLPKGRIPCASTTASSVRDRGSTSGSGSRMLSASGEQCHDAGAKTRSAMACFNGSIPWPVALEISK